MGKAHRISGKDLCKFKSFRALSKKPKTQLKVYKQHGAHKDTLTLVRQSSNTFSAKCKDFARVCFPLMEPPSGMQCDHVDTEGNTYRQVTARWTSAGKHGSWEHLQPSRQWDYLLLVYLDFKGVSYYRLSRNKFNELCQIGIIKKFKSRQQESTHTDGRYSLNKGTSFNGRPEKFLDFAEKMNKYTKSRRVSELESEMQ